MNYVGPLEWLESTGRHPGLVSVYLYAAPEARVATVKEHFSLDESHARQLIAEIDADRSRFLRETTGRNLQAESVHLCIDTGRISLEVAEKMVLLAVAEVRGRIPLEIRGTSNGGASAIASSV